MSDRPELPPVVYVPSVEPVHDPASARVEMRRTRDGRTALLVYSALDRLRRCCGPSQPWVLVRTTALEDIHTAQPFDLLLMDVVIPTEHQRGAVA